MKQNERLLVYAVTGFLAVILVIAVVFGREPGADAGKRTGSEVQGLSQLLGGDAGVEADKKAAGASETGAPDPSAPAASLSGLPTPGQVTPTPPLVAGNRAQLAAELVAQQLGPNRRDRTVRFVRARPGDSLESIVRRWCGARDPFLAEAKCLNEDLVVLKAGQEVGVPWVDDDAVLAALEAQKPRLLASGPADGDLSLDGSLRDGTRRDGGTNAAGEPTPATGRPSFAEPGRTLEGAVAPALRAGTTYTVKSGDSLWRIADRTYGSKEAGRMVGEIRRANPGLGETLPVGKKLVLPPK
ncbi:MAG TPA: LysM domain-containing protein [Planctomycetota bacterium]|nr:LysM domain-containing protein [Planctomycetota bacterium]